MKNAPESILELVKQGLTLSLVWAVSFSAIKTILGSLIAQGLSGLNDAKVIKKVSPWYVAFQFVSKPLYLSHNGDRVHVKSIKYFIFYVAKILKIPYDQFVIRQSIGQTLIAI